MNQKDSDLEKLELIKLEPVDAADYCQYSVIEHRLVTLYHNQEKILEAIKIAAKISQERI